MNSKHFLQSPYVGPTLLILSACLLQLATAGNYGLFQDEYYYIACARHLDFCYVDHPALVSLLTRISVLFGSSPLALHILPALAMAGTMLLSAYCARLLGGSRFAMFLVSLAFLDATLFWVMFGFMSVNAFDIFFVTAAATVFLRVLTVPSLSTWILLGATIGLGVNSKLTMVTFAGSMLLGVIMTEQRKLLKSAAPYAGIALAVSMVVPFLLWQAAHQWPTLQFVKSAAEKNLAVSPIQFFIALTLGMGIINMLLAVSGLWFLWRSRNERSFRSAAVAATIFFAAYLLNRSNFYYVTPVFPLLLAGGAVQCERWTAGKRIAWVRYAIAGVLLISTVIKLPLGVPILPIDSYVGYYHTLTGKGGAAAVRTDKTQSDEVPNYFGKRFGNREVAVLTATVYHSLPDSDRARCGILCINYTYAGIIDYYQEELGLPTAISGHNNYWLWGTHGYTTQCMIAIGANKNYWEKCYASVEEVSRFIHPYEGPETRLICIFLCRDPYAPLNQQWEKLRVYR